MRAPLGSPKCVTVVTVRSHMVSRNRVSNHGEMAPTLSRLSYPQRFNTQSCPSGVTQVSTLSAPPWRHASGCLILVRRRSPYLGYRIPRDSTHNRAPPGSPTCVTVVTFSSPIVSRSKVSRPDKTAATLSWISYPQRFNTQSCSIGVAQMCNNRHCQLPRNVTHWGI